MLTFASMTLGNNVGVGRDIGAHGRGQSEGGVTWTNSRTLQMWTTENWTFGLENTFNVRLLQHSLSLNKDRRSGRGPGVTTPGVTTPGSRRGLYCCHTHGVTHQPWTHTQPLLHTNQGKHGDTGQERCYSYTQEINAHPNTKVSRCYFTSSDASARQRKRCFTR